MQLINQHPALRASILACLILFSLPLLALKSDREKPLQVFAKNTDGFLGDGLTTLSGDVDIRQGSLHITADEAKVNKVDGRVTSVTFHGKPAYLEQEIEEQGMVKATAAVIKYQVASGLVTLTGHADVIHPQYRISGDQLTYDLNIQHFRGTSNDNSDGRVRIQLDPEVIDKAKNSKEKQDGTEAPATPADDDIPDSNSEDSDKNAQS